MVKPIYIGAGLGLLALALATGGTAAPTSLPMPVNAEQLGNIKELVKAFRIHGDGDLKKLAYILATSYGETRYRSIKEIRATPGTEVYTLQSAYWDTGFYGRGLSQLTWEANYKKFSPIVGVDLVAFPDAALDPHIGAPILVVGMMTGKFTGRKLADYLGPGLSDWFNARRTVNGIGSKGSAPYRAALADAETARQWYTVLKAQAKA